MTIKKLNKRKVKQGDIICIRYNVAGVEYNQFYEVIKKSGVKMSFKRTVNQDTDWLLTDTNLIYTISL